MLSGRELQALASCSPQFISLPPKMWPRVQPGILRGVRAAAGGLCVSERAAGRRAAAAGWQVALAATKFARLWILDWTLVS